MTIRLLITLFTLSIGSSLCSQEQISDIDRFSSFRINSGFFHTYDDYQFIIVDKNNVTQALRVRGEQFGELSEIHSRPFTTWRQGFILDKQSIISSYRGGFTISDLETGITTDTVYFDEYSHFLNRAIVNEGRHIVHILKDEERNTYLHAYNIYGQFSQIYNIEGLSFVIGKNNIQLLDDEGKIYNYDFESNSLDFLNQLSEEVIHSRRLDSYIVFIEKNGELHIYSDDLSYKTVDCIDNLMDVHDMIIKEDKLVISEIRNSAPEERTRVYDLNTCEILASYNREYTIDDFPYLSNSSLLFQYNGNSPPQGLFRIFDLDNLSLSSIDIDAKKIELESSHALGDQVHLTALNENFVRSNIILDLPTLSTSKLTIGENDDNSLLYRSYSLIENTTTYVIRHGANTSIWQLDHDTGDQIQLDQSVLESNVGLAGVNTSNIAVRPDNSLLFTSISDLYLTKENTTTKLLENVYTPELLQIGDETHILVERNDSLYAAIYRDDDITHHFLSTEYHQGSFSVQQTDKAIFLPDNKYYNAETVSLDSIFILSNNPDNYLETSGDRVIIGKTSGNFSGNYTYNTTTSELKSLSYLDDKSFYAYDLGESKFLISTGFSWEPTGEVFILDENNERKLSKTIDSYQPYYYKPFHQGNSYMSLARIGEDITYFYMTDNIESKVLQVDNEATNLSDDLTIGYYEDDIVIRVNKNGFNQFAHVSWDEEATYFGELFEFDKVEDIFINSTVITIVVYNFVNGDVTTTQYDKDTKELIQSNSLEIGYEANILNNFNHKINDTIILMDFDDGIHGEEFFKLDINTLEYTLISDMYPGPISSHPSFVTSIDSEVYFFAFNSEYTRQLFKYDISGDISVVGDVPDVLDFVIYPNPASHFIILDEYMTSYTIYDMNGYAILLENTHSHKTIDISDLSAGVYIITGTTVSGKIIRSKFVKT